MKKLFLIIVAVLSGTIAIAQWTQQYPYLQNNELTSVYFTDADTGYIVGNHGAILKTTNSGVNWAGLSSGTTDDLYSICFSDHYTGYAVGSSGTILKTSDGGISWSAQSSGTTNVLFSVCFPADNIGYIAGAGNTFLKTIDGGLTWTSLLEYFGEVNLYSVFFTDTNTGYVVSNYTIHAGAILQTVDGGITWSDVASQAYSLLNSVYFADSIIGYAVGGRGQIIKTIDGGKDWTEVNLLNSPGYNSVRFTDANTGYVVGNSGTILKTSNGGADWVIQNSDTTYNLNSVFFTDANNGYAVGSSGMILKTTNGGGTTSGIDDQPSITNTLEIYPNPSFDEITIEISASPAKGDLSIFNTSGQELNTRRITESRTVVDISSLSSGVYFVRLSGEKAVQVGKFVKQIEK
jgi:photosystem II stability/assembly factor-like uncharacterized protein